MNNPSRTEKNAKVSSRSHPPSQIPEKCRIQTMSAIANDRNPCYTVSIRGATCTGRRSGKESWNSLMNNTSSHRIMTRCDCHLHTDNSFDSETPAEQQAERARALGIRVIALTDHCDILEWSDARIARSNAQAAELNRRYDDLTVLRGIELGQPLQDLPETERALALCEYDFVLCSLHNIRGEEDFYYLHPDEAQARVLIRRYFDELMETVEWGQFDSLAHFTYPLRYIVGRDGVPVDMTPFQPIIRRILTNLAAKGKALEINTSGLRSPDGFLLPTVEYIRLFRELGGKYITLGSDAHSPEQVAVGMTEGISAARQAGFTCATVFINRQPVGIPFE